MIYNEYYDMKQYETKITNVYLNQIPLWTLNMTLLRRVTRKCY